jgi:hypothetical protein
MKEGILLLWGHQILGRRRVQFYMTDTAWRNLSQAWNWLSPLKYGKARTHVQ